MPPKIVAITMLYTEKKNRLCSCRCKAYGMDKSNSSIMYLANTPTLYHGSLKYQDPLRLKQLFTISFSLYKYI